MTISVVGSQEEVLAGATVSSITDTVVTGIRTSGFVAVNILIQFVYERANRTPITNPYIITPGDTGGFFVDPRDFILDEITVGPNGIRWSEGAI